jgi:hypothetical protein
MPLEQLGGEIPILFLSYGHKAGHLGLGDRDLLAAPIGKAEIGNNEIPGSRGGLAGGGLAHNVLMLIEKLAPD